MEWSQIAWAGLMAMILLAMWPAYRRWRENPVEAESGDWSTALFVIGFVVLFVLLLIWSVQ